MQQQRSEDTRPERELRQELHRRGLRFRLHRKIVVGTNRRADIVFGPARVAVFVDGCFWHGCPRHGKRESSVNSWYWPDKIARNVDRDRDTDARLRSDGWLVVRIWEHEERARAADRIERAVLQRRGKLS